MNSRPWVWWVLTLLWAGKIFWFSTEGFSGDHSGSYLRKLFGLLHLSVDQLTFRAIHVALRKSAHVWEYAILSVLAYRSLSKGEQSGFQPRMAAWAVLVAAVYSLTDEFHQAFVLGRGPSLMDCVIDTSGAILGVFLVRICWRVFESRPLKRVAS